MHTGSKYDPCKKLLVSLKTIGWIILNKKAEKVESKIVVMFLGHHLVLHNILKKVIIKNILSNSKNMFYNAKIA